MNSNVHPLVVALVLILTGIALATWMWGSGAAANIGGPSEMTIDPDSHVYVQIQDKLIEHDANGRFLKTHNLDELGVDRVLGGLAFFSNGDILLRRGPDPRSFDDNVRAFQRRTNQNSIEPESADAGLFRCELDTKHCERFGKHGIDFKAVRGVFIDWTTDEVYISDTTRHVLRKYSADGTALAGPIHGFKFPNQLMLHDKKLLVADTNHHEIRSIDPTTQSFGDVLEKNSVTPALATAADQIWPSHFVRVGDKWWVNNMRTGMNYGGIYLFDDNWRLIRRLEMPDDADPIALVATGDDVWISDWYGDKVHRFSKAGEPLTDLESAGLESILSQARIERRSFELISYSGIALLLLVLGGLAVRGFAVGMNTDSRTNVDEKRRSKVQVVESALDLEPDPKSLRKMARMMRLFVLMLVILAGVIVYIILFDNKTDVLVGLILPGIGMLIIAVTAFWVSRSNRGTAIRIDGNTVTLRDHTGRESSCPMRETRYDHTAIATHEVIVFLGRPMASVYKRKDLKERLFPRLIEATRVSPFEMQKILIQQRHPQGVMVILGMISFLAYSAWVIMK